MRFVYVLVDRITHYANDCCFFRLVILALHVNKIKNALE